MMALRFIGEDGTYGLVKNQVYEVELFAKGSYIWVRWGTEPGPGCTGYLTPKAFATNWEGV